jgi:F-type H+-transporting ATPase subunit b
VAGSPAGSLAQEHVAEGGGGGIFSLNVGLIFWTWVLFLFTLGILAWKVFPVISGGLEERHAKIQGAIDDARRAREDSEAMRAEQEQALAAARSESQELIEKARAAAEGVKKEILAEARVQQEALLADARAEMQLERRRLREDIRREAVEISLSVAERLIRTRLDGEENRRLVTEYLAEL